MTRGLPDLIRDVEEEDQDEEFIRRLLVQEADGAPLATKDIPHGEIFIRLKSPAVVFLSLKMPSVESLRALEEVRTTLSFQPAVVVIAPPASSEFKMQMLGRGIYAYLEKPIREGQVKRLMEDILENHREAVS